MTHFLARLVERTRGAVPRVEPIVAPRFAPPPVAEIASEIEAVPPVSRIEPSPVEGKLPNRGIVKQEVAEAAGPEEETSARSVEPVSERLLVPPEIAMTGPPLVVRQDGLEEQATLLVRNGAVRKESFPGSVMKRPGLPPLAPTAARVRRAIEQPAIAPDKTAPEPPIVRVTIGRIEVRAAPAPAPAPRKPPRAAGPKLTLDAYLKSRQEGAR